LKQTQNDTNEATKSLKTKEGIFETKLKRTQNEPHLRAEMRTFRTEFELFHTTPVLVAASNGEDEWGRDRPAVGIQRTSRNCENRGNEAKKCLKTKDITFSNAANCMRFPHQFTAIGLEMEQITADFAKTKSGLGGAEALPQQR